MFSAYVRVWDATQLKLGEPVCFFSNVAIGKELAINSATLTLEEGSAGSFKFTITRENVAYDLLNTMTSIIYIYKDGNMNKPFWVGRMIEEERDIYDCRQITCEGTLNCLMDTYQQPKHINCGVLSWLQYLLVQDYHDPEAPEGQYARCHDFHATYELWKQVQIKYFDPAIEPGETVDWYANYETTWDLLKNVIEAYNIKMEVSWEPYNDSGNNYYMGLSFYSDYPANLQSDQTIMFGRNLINYTRNWSIDDLATIIVPTGKKYNADDEERPTVPYTPPDLDAVVTIQSVNNGNIELSANNDVIARYGRIIKHVEWSDIEEPANLLDLAQDYFSKYQWDKLTIEVELYDLSILMTGAEKAENELFLLGTVRCVSPPHGLDRYFPIIKIEYDFNNPGNTKYTLGTEDSSSTLTGAVASVSTNLKNDIDKNKVQESRIFNEVISRAFDDATTLMNNYANTGHVAFTKNPLDGSQLTGIVISDKVNWSDNTAKLWMWNQGGLAWSEDGGRTFKGVAITNDGRISANFITAGTLNANIIRAGTLQDVTGNTAWNMETGVFKTRDYTLETVSPYIPGSDGYMYLSNKIWRNASAFATSSNTLTISGQERYDWRMIVGQNFGISEDGTLAINEGHIGDIGIHENYLRSESTTLGFNESFFLGSGDSGTLVTTDNEGTYEVAGVTRSDWHLTIGNNFGVTGGGYLYSRSGIFTSASVAGSLSASNLNITRINGSKASILLTETATEASSESYQRTMVIRVSRVDIPGQNAWRAQIMAYPMISGGDHSDVIDSDITVQFYLGNWEHYVYNSETDSYQRVAPNSASNWFIGPIHYKDNSKQTLTDYTFNYFNVNGSTDHAITIPEETRSTNPYVTYVYGVYSSSGTVYDITAIMLSSRTSGSSSSLDPARPIWTTQADVQTYGWTDSWYVTHNVGGTRHNAMMVNGSLIPNSNDQILGDINHKWKQIYSRNAVIVSSSRTLKKDITEIPENFDIFYDNLSPVQYRWKDSEDMQKHSGFILDEVGYALQNADIDTNDFAGYQTFNPANPLDDGGLRYEEFIALNTWQIQKAKQRISELEERIEALERERNE